MVSIRCRRRVRHVMHVHNSASSFIMTSVEVIIVCIPERGSWWLKRTVQFVVVYACTIMIACT